MKAHTIYPAIAATVAFAAAIAAAQPPDGALERRAVVRLGGCTAFVTERRALVTAKHCGVHDRVSVTIDGQPVVARLAAVGQGSDGPVVYLLPAGRWPSLPLAQQVPQRGDRVYTVGYPGGHWARVEGTIVGGNGVDQNYVQLRINPGHSGGPLLNQNGEVIGVATELHENSSVFVGWRVTRDAVRQALAANPRPALPQPIRPIRPITTDPKSSSSPPAAAQPASGCGAMSRPATSATTASPGSIGTSAYASGPIPICIGNSSPAAGLTPPSSHSRPSGFAAPINTASATIRPAAKACCNGWPPVCDCCWKPSSAPRRSLGGPPIRPIGLARSPTSAI